MNHLENSPVRMMDYIHFMQHQRYMVNAMVTCIFMWMDREGSIIIFGIMVLVVTNKSIAVRMVSSNLGKVILFIFTWPEPFAGRVQNAQEHISKVILSTFCKITSIFIEYNTIFHLHESGFLKKFVSLNVPERNRSRFSWTERARQLNICLILLLLSQYMNKDSGRWRYWYV